MIAPTNKPTLVQWEHLSFVIMDAPNDSNLHLYLKELKKHNVTDLVRACEVTYSRESVEAAGIKVHELEFPDGEPPDADILDKWLDLVSDCFKDNKIDLKNNKSIAVHCVAGLGRCVFACGLNLRMLFAEPNSVFACFFQSHAVPPCWSPSRS